MADTSLVASRPRPSALSNWRRVVAELPLSAKIGILFVSVVVIGTVFAPLFTAADPTLLTQDILLPPSWDHPMGTDDLGRDVLARVLYGGRTSLTVGLFSALVGMLLGMTVGMTAGYFGGFVDEALMRVTEVFQILPRLLVAIVVVTLVGGSFINVVFVIGFLAWPPTARIIRGRVQVVRQEEFMAAAVMSGASRLRVIVRHALPNVLAFFVVSAALQVASAILSESALSFLGLGDPSRPSWGLMLQQGQLYLRRAWWIMTFPGLALALAILGLNLMGDGLGSKLPGGRK